MSGWQPPVRPVTGVPGAGLPPWPGTGGPAGAGVGAALPGGPVGAAFRVPAVRTAARTPAFWIMLVLTTLTSLGTIVVAVFMLVLTPRALSVSIVAVLAYVTLWLALLLRVADPVERRPAWLVALAVAWGGTVSCAVGGGGGYFLDGVIAKAISPTFAAQWGAALVAPPVEEAAKAAGVVLILLAARPYLTTVWSGASYGALIGVGFAATEDVGYAGLYADMALPDDVTVAAQVLVLRFTTPGLVGHPLMTAVAGAGIAYAWLRVDHPRRRRLGVLVGALTGAGFIHFVGNSPLAAEAAVAVDAVGGASELAGYFVVVTAAAVPALYWLAALRRQDARLVLTRASAILPAALPACEIAVLAGLRARFRADRQVRRAHGAAAARAARRLRRAQLRLAAALARPHRGFVAAAPPYWLAPAPHRWWQEATAARLALPPVNAAPDDGPPGRAGRSRVPGYAVAVLVAAVAGLLFWPVAVVAVAGAIAVRWRWGGPNAGRLLAAAGLAATFTGYVWLVSALLTVVYPS